MDREVAQWLLRFLWLWWKCLGQREMTVAQDCGCGKCHWLVHFRWLISHCGHHNKHINQIISLYILKLYNIMSKIAQYTWGNTVKWFILFCVNFKQTSSVSRLENFDLSKRLPGGGDFVSQETFGNVEHSDCCSLGCYYPVVKAGDVIQIWQWLKTKPKMNRTFAPTKEWSSPNCWYCQGWETTVELCLHACLHSSPNSPTSPKPSAAKFPAPPIPHSALPILSLTPVSPISSTRANAQVWVRGQVGEGIYWEKTLCNAWEMWFPGCQVLAPGPRNTGGACSAESWTFINRYKLDLQFASWDILREKVYKIPNLRVSFQEWGE